MRVNTWAIFRVGIKFLAGLGVFPGQALSQGAMAPGGLVAPLPSRVAPPPSQAPTVAPSSTVLTPHPSVRPSPPTATVVGPQPGDAGRLSIPPSTRGASRWSSATALQGVSFTWSGPGGRGRAVTDDKGILALPALPQGTYDIAFDTSGTATNQASPKLLVGLLLPAVQRVRTASRSFTPGLKGTAKLEVGLNDQVKVINWIWNHDRDVSDVSADENDARVAAFGRGIRLVFAVSSKANTNGGR